MKTNIVMNSEDRKIFGITIRQETKTGFLNLSDLQEAYLHARVKNGWSQRGEIQHILSQKENSERIYYLLKKRLLINCDFSHFISMIEKHGLIKTLKEFSVYKTSGARQNKTTWCNPDIWVLVAMELNPMLYAEVISWISDKLILNRIEAGNFYKDLSRAISKFENADYIKMAKALNYKIFGRHETGIRNLATKDQLEKMFELERYIAKAIDMGHLKNFDDCIVEIEKY